VRYLIRMIPLLVAMTVALAGLQLYYGVASLYRHAWPFAALYLLCGIAGLALATALWRARRSLRSPES
jgi:hypothetical protein